MQVPFLRKSGRPFNQPPKTPTQHTRERKAGASALFNTISTLQPLPIFFPLFWHLNILKNQTGRRLLLPPAPGGFDFESWAEIFCFVSASSLVSGQQPVRDRSSSFFIRTRCNRVARKSANNGTTVAIGSKIKVKSGPLALFCCYLDGEIGWSCNFSMVHLPLGLPAEALDYAGSNPRVRSAWSTRSSRLELSRSFWRTSTILDVDETWWWVSHSLGRVLNRYWATSWSAKKGK